MLHIQLEIFLLIAIGYTVAKCGIINANMRKRLIDLVIYVILPCNIFCSFWIEMSTEILQKCALALIIALALQLLYPLLNQILYRKFEPRHRVITQYGTIGSNAGFLGLPVVNAVFGPIGVLYASVALIPLRVAMWSSGLMLFTKTTPKTILKTLATHPCILAVVAGFLYMFFQPQFPRFLSDTFTSLSNCTTAMSMIVVGSILSEVPLKSVFDKECFYFSFIRLIAIPLVVFGVLTLLKVDDLVRGVSVLASAMPAATTMAMLAVKYEQDEVFASKILFVSTLLSLVTLPLISLLLTKT